MVKKEKIKENINLNEQSNDIYKVWAENYTDFLKMCSDSYREFYEEWIKTYQNSFGKFYPIPAMDSGKEAAKYKECYDMWISTYEKMFDDFISLPIMKSVRENIGNYTGIPDIYSETYMQMTKLCRDSYSKLYMPWEESALTLSEKASEIAKGNVNPETYKEFCDLWVKMYEKAFDTFFEDMPMVGPMKDTMESVKVAAKTYADAYVKMSRILTS
jgi:hypothetical protein